MPAPKFLYEPIRVTNLATSLVSSSLTFIVSKHCTTANLTLSFGVANNMNKASSLLFLSRLSAISKHIPDIGDSSYNALYEKNLINLTIFLNVL